MHITEEKLKSILVQSGLITAEDFDVAHEESRRNGQTVTNVLIGNEKIPEDYLTELEFDQTTDRPVEKFYSEAVRKFGFRFNFLCKNSF